MNLDVLKNSSSLLPEVAGVYLFYDRSDKLLYVGKAKNLKKRVSSYFRKKNGQRNKISVLVNQISSINHILVENESDALLLENSLIKKHQPKYNVLLKDDKTFPWICIKNERFPRVFSTRTLIKDGSEYFGPYTSAYTVRTLLELIRQLYKLRNCSYLLSEKNIENKKFKICLEYHIGNCLGPCENLQAEKEYNDSIRHIKEIIKGNLHLVIEHLKTLMIKLSDELKFEEASFIKSKIDLLEKFQSKSVVVNSKIHDLDVFSFIDDKKSAFVNFLKIVNGAIIHSHTIELVRKLDESQYELLLFAITDFRQRFQSSASEIIVPFRPNEEIKNVKFIVPKKGDRKKLLELSFKNASSYQIEKLRRVEELIIKKRESNVLNKLKNDLRLKEIPVHIECFDNSNIQGKFPVASCVVFVNGIPKKAEYRHFNIKTVQGIDDFASMKEIVFRRYRRLLDEQKSLPQLIIIDGGKGQLNMALKSLEELGIKEKITVIGIAKKLEKIFFANDPVPLYINKNSSSLKLIQKIRNEAHRFGISFHRNKREKSVLINGIESIPGIGNATIKKLIDHFGDYSKIELAGIEELNNVIDISKSEKIYNFFRKNSRGS